MPAREYHLTLDMAKELAMVENNQQGRVVRRYFIAAEKQLRAAVQPQQALPSPTPATQGVIDDVDMLIESIVALTDSCRSLDELKRALTLWSQLQQRGKVYDHFPLAELISLGLTAAEAERFAALLADANLLWAYLGRWRISGPPVTRPAVSMAGNQDTAPDCAELAQLIAGLSGGGFHHLPAPDGERLVRFLMAKQRLPLDRSHLAEMVALQLFLLSGKTGVEAVG